MESHEPVIHRTKFRFFAELNDFLSREFRNTKFTYQFRGRPSIKDTIQAIGVPHPEIDVILVNGHSVDFDFILKGGEDVTVYPEYDNSQKPGIIHLRPKLPSEKKFIIDVNLGKLVPKLRLLGFDTLFEDDDHEIVEISNRENRIILTRDIGILKYNAVKFGYWVRNTRPFAQVAEVVQKFHLSTAINPFTRCTICNGILVPADKDQIADKIPPQTYQLYDAFTQCRQCGKIFWQGSHVEKIKEWIKELK